MIQNYDMSIVLINLYAQPNLLSMFGLEEEKKGGEKKFEI